MLLLVIAYAGAAVAVVVDRQRGTQAVLGIIVTGHLTLIKLGSGRTDERESKATGLAIVKDFTVKICIRIIAFVFAFTDKLHFRQHMLQWISGRC